MTGLLSLPTELLQDLGGRATEKTLRLVCKQINFALAPQTLSTIVLSSECLSSQVESLVATQPKPTSASKYATQLKIYGLYPAEHENRVVSVEQEAKIKSFLLSAIGSLIGVRKVAWYFWESDPEWATLLVLEALASLPFLEDFHLCFWGSPNHPLQLHRLSKLRKLALTFGSTLLNCSAIISSVARFIGCNQATLTTLIIDDHDYDGGEDAPTLQGFLAETSSSVCLNITHLSLSGLPVKLDATSLRHLRLLISLTIENIFLPKGQISGDQDGAGFFSGNIWSILRLEKIHLQEIVTDDVQLALIEYLASFSGLRLLRLTRASSHLTTPLVSNQLAVQFYERALQNHFSFLKSLEINSNYEGRWSFGSHCSSIFKKCVCLTSLTLSLNSEDIPRREEGKVDDDAEDPDRENTIWSLLDICTTLPVLKKLTVFSAFPEYTRGSKCGTSANMHRCRTNAKIAEELKSYGPINSKHVFRVAIAWEEFEVRRDDWGTNLGYRPIAQIEED